MSGDEEWFDDEAGPVVRPYAVTGGRTRPSNRTLDLVALVSTSPQGRAIATTLEPEQRAIAVLCQRLQSVVEISARLNLPVGVARVLVGDMLDAGLVSVHRPERTSDRPSVAIIEKVLSGLQAL
ncbi:DUF742 domain-containing protein [Frankia sp. Mgl5]|uniref:DUF742 domain-containing protein n=1 Tax=Parafrankia soli TaxID=2599596 RepID=A0A1S1PGH9_9ACTN|nr:MULTISPECIES: DUF742 domain-containing protein [Frankiaceae]ABW11818.1 protein of unknown function DUF742 [Frankia sp. EAN1pec]CAI7980873.1 conserved hypothetical protein [Frankia sp. Hr75.2]MCK9927913.1 DUF742 domain-containing protein [Frankia sp. Mgl5]OHV20321.1 hypothetical protein BBK14_08450 [Parafrankia soli]TCJ33996.1 DUF742 domain-containing protein [Parafrankia sp. BMG5.11]